MKTTLRRLGPSKAARLVRHGYVLAMANLQVILGYELRELPAAARFDELGRGKP